MGSCSGKDTNTTKILGRFAIMMRHTFFILAIIIVRKIFDSTLAFPPQSEQLCLVLGIWEAYCCQCQAFSSCNDQVFHFENLIYKGTIFPVLSNVLEFPPIYRDA